MLDWIIFALIGILSGLSSGLLGLGGGVIIVPALLMVFSWQGLSSSHVMHTSIATSLMTIIVTSITSSYTHHKLKQVDWKVVTRLVPSLVFGGLLGGFLATQLTSQILKNLFSFYLLFAAIRMWLPVSFSYHRHFLNKFVLFAFGSTAGLISSLVGIGGGTLVVPYLLMANLPVQRAIGTSASCGFPIAIAAVLGFIIFGQQQNSMQTQSTGLGFIYWPAFWGIISTSSIFAVIGVKLASRFSIVRLKLIFSTMLLMIVAYLTIK